MDAARVRLFVERFVEPYTGMPLIGVGGFCTAMPVVERVDVRYDGVTATSTFAVSLTFRTTTPGWESRSLRTTLSTGATTGTGTLRLPLAHRTSLPIVRPHAWPDIPFARAMDGGYRLESDGTDGGSAAAWLSAGEPAVVANLPHADHFRRGNPIRHIWRLAMVRYISMESLTCGRGQRALSS